MVIVQEDLAVVKNSLIQTESSKYGPVVGATFGLPGHSRVYRHAAYRHHAAIAKHCEPRCTLDGAVVSLSFSCRTVRGRCCTPDWYGRLPESSSYYQDLQNSLHEVHNGFQGILTTSEAGISSVHEVLYEAGPLRGLLRAMIPEGWTLNVLEADSHAMDVSLIPPAASGAVPLSQYFGLATVICRARHLASCVPSGGTVDIYDALPTAIKLDRLKRHIARGCPWDGLDPGEVEDPLTETARNLLRKALPSLYMSQHSYYGDHWDAAEERRLLGHEAT